jgi:hypothetical protein
MEKRRKSATNMREYGGEFRYMSAVRRGQAVRPPIFTIIAYCAKRMVYMLADVYIFVIRDIKTFYIFFNLLFYPIYGVKPPRQDGAERRVNVGQKKFLDFRLYLDNYKDSQNCCISKFIGNPVI